MSIEYADGNDGIRLVVSNAKAQRQRGGKLVVQAGQNAQVIETLRSTGIRETQNARKSTPWHGPCVNPPPHTASPLHHSPPRRLALPSTAPFAPPQSPTQLGEALGHGAP